MCGILTILDPFGAPPRAASHAARAAHLLRRLEHRGPDGSGICQLARAWLGHTRLAIMDPEHGHQPFVHSGMAWVANAEIFNHAELAARFGSAASRSDCAVIGPAWRALGPDTPGGLDGQFAFVCTDIESGAWIAARDHVGISPLYVGEHTDGTLWFASEMKALVDDCERVAIVPPGHAWHSDGSGTRLERWYTPDWEFTVPNRAVDEAALRASLVEAVRKRMESDAPWGVLLSGGVDSSLVAAIATRIRRQSGLAPPRSFSIGLADAPDLSAARRVADFLGTDHLEVTFTLEEGLALIPAAVRHLESYQQVRTAVPTMLLAKAVARTGTKMVLSGEGADEILGGYLYFHSAPTPEEFHRETVRKTLRLHTFDVMRANKAPMAHGVELRFPFLDRAFMDLVMSLDPRHRMTAAGGIEKRILRRAFHNPADPWLPDSILWRQKEQFSDGVGYSWVDAVRAAAAMRCKAGELARLTERFSYDVPINAEMLWMRELFEQEFLAGRTSGSSALDTVGTGASIACSTPEAIAWNPAWSRLAGDISGRAITSVHQSACPLA
jgi:asparagine synthase (glutamine-hydrolysing)